jgi:hypothetical protein
MAAIVAHRHLRQHRPAIRPPPIRFRRAPFAVLSPCLLLAQDAALAHGIPHIVVPDRSTVAVAASLQ